MRTRTSARLAGTLVALLGLPSQPSSAWALTPTNGSAKRRRSPPMVRVYFSSAKEPGATKTAFVILGPDGKGRLVTAGGEEPARTSVVLSMPQSRLQDLGLQAPGVHGPSHWAVHLEGVGTRVTYNGAKGQRERRGWGIQQGQESALGSIQLVGGFDSGTPARTKAGLGKRAIRPAKSTSKMVTVHGATPPSRGGGPVDDTAVRGRVVGEQGGELTVRTDRPVNGSHAGGPVLNRKGELVGVIIGQGEDQNKLRVLPAAQVLDQLSLLTAAAQ